MTAFATRYREKYGKPPSTAAVLSHDAFSVWVEAVRRAGAGEMLIPAVRLAAMLADSDRGAQLFDQLTGREREVLRLLAAGLENKAIAARMGIGYVTVRSHVRNLSSKLDARSRLEVVAKASELGLIGR